MSRVAARAFRDCVGEFATGVTVVTAESERGPAGMTLNAFSSVSLDPLLVLVALGHASRTLAAARASGRFAISILHRGQQQVALDFAERDALFPAQHVVRDRDGYLTVPQAAATLRCSLVETIEGGDHLLLLGAVESIEHGGGEPLIFHRGRLGGIVADAVVPAGHPISIEEGAGW
jgi:flavin reductase (DIM6/NTAB) family NADH-FMN oxidoreductase RutF